MARSIANLNISSDSFLNWVTKTNQLLEALTNDVITVSTTITGGNTTLANTTGNAQLLGIFGANTIVATDALRGGNATTAATLSITTNTTVTGDTLKVNSNVTINTSSLYIGSSTGTKLMPPK
jgi:hypothetical protein